MHAVLFAGRTRIKGMHGVISSADNFLFKTTSSTGATVMTIPADAGDLDPYIPDDGVLFTAGAYLPMDQGDITGLTVYLDAQEFKWLIPLRGQQHSIKLLLLMK